MKVYGACHVPMKNCTCPSLVLHISLPRGIEINPRSVDDHVFCIHDLFIHDFVFMIYLSRFTHLRFAYREHYAFSHQNAERFPIIFFITG